MFPVYSIWATECAAPICSAYARGGVKNELYATLTDDITSKPIYIGRNAHEKRCLRKATDNDLLHVWKSFKIMPRIRADTPAPCDLMMTLI